MFQDGRQPLTLWFRAIWWVTSQKIGASVLGLQRVLSGSVVARPNGRGCTRFARHGQAGS